MSGFEKYERAGAYHWEQANPHWRNPQFNPALVARYQMLLRFVPSSIKYALDVGCGDGYLMHLLFAAGALKVYGIDNNGVGISLAYQQLSRHDGRRDWWVALASGDKIPMRDNQFDAVILADVIEHLTKPEKTLIEITRVLRPDGILLLSTPNKNPQHIWDKRHVIEFTPDSLRALLIPHFREITLHACWPMRWYYRWARGGRWQRFIAWLSRVGYNPFCQLTKHPSLAYGQLLAVCEK